MIYYFVADAEVLLSLMNGVEEKLSYCDVSEQVKFIRQIFRQQSRDLKEKQLQNLMSSLGSKAGSSSANPTSVGGSAASCFKSPTKVHGTKDAGTPHSSVNLAPSLGPKAGSSSTNTTSEGDNATSCLKSQPKEDAGTTPSTVNLAASLVSAEGSSFTTPTSEVGSSSNCTKSQPEGTDKPSSFQDTIEEKSNEELASGSSKDPSSKTDTASVEGRVLRPRKAKVGTSEKQENQLLSLNPLKLPVDLLNFCLKQRDPRT